MDDLLFDMFQEKDEEVVLVGNFLAVSCTRFNLCYFIEVFIQIFKCGKVTNVTCNILHELLKRHLKKQDSGGAILDWWSSLKT